MSPQKDAEKVQLITMSVGSYYTLSQFGGYPLVSSSYLMQLNIFRPTGRLLHTYNYHHHHHLVKGSSSQKMAEVRKVGEI
jgi:hypothetical protein